MIYTNICINLVTISWILNIAFSLLKTFMNIYDKIKAYVAKRVKVDQITKITEVKVVNDKEFKDRIRNI